MTSGGRSISALVVLAAGLGFLIGCAPLGGPAGAEPRTELLRVDVPLREPVWVPEKEAVLALSEDRRRIVRVGVGGEGRRVPVRSEAFEDVGENVALSPEEPEKAYLPRPGAGKISVLDTDSLREVDSYEVAGASPSYATVDVQSEIMFAISQSGSEVSGVEFAEPEKAPVVEVEGNPETLVEAPEKGLDPAFWTAGPGGVAFYGGDPPERLVGFPIEATDVAVDLTSAQRAYVAEASRVVALEGDPEGLLEGKLEVLATRDLGEGVERVASDELHVYAATRSKLVAMRRETLEPVQELEFGRLLEREGIGPAEISGITVGKEYVYLTFEGEPYLLSVEKP